MGLELWQVTITGQVNGNYYNNVLHADVNNTGPAAENQVADNLASTLFPAPDEALVGLMAACLPTFSDMRTLRMKRLVEPGHTWVYQLQDGGDPIPGLRTGDPMPSQISPGILLYTAIANKTGKIFIAGLSESDCSGDIIVAGLQTSLFNLGEFWRIGGTLISSGFAWTGVIPHRSPEGVYTWEGITFVQQPLRVWQQGRRRYPA